MTSPTFQGPDWTAALHHLQTGPRYRFSEWINGSVVPPVAAGVYAIWRDEALLYVGMSGSGQSGKMPVANRDAASRKAKGLASRLNSHANGRRSGDQFCVYVCDRLVLPLLTPEEVAQVADGTLLLDAKTRTFIRTHFDYSYALVRDGANVRALERVARGGALAAGRPFLNPA